MKSANQIVQITHIRMHNRDAYPLPILYRKFAKTTSSEIVKLTITQEEESDLVAIPVSI